MYRDPEPARDDPDYSEFREPSVSEKNDAAEFYEGEFYQGKRQTIALVAEYLAEVLDVDGLTRIAACRGMRSHDISEYIYKACQAYVDSWGTDDWADWRGET